MSDRPDVFEWVLRHPDAYHLIQLHARLVAIETALVAAEHEARSAAYFATDWQAQSAATAARYQIGVARRRLRHVLGERDDSR